MCETTLTSKWVSPNIGLLSLSLGICFGNIPDFLNNVVHFSDLFSISIIAELVNNAETDVKRIHTLYSPGDDGNELQFQKIFKDDFAKPWLKMFEQPREDIDGVSISGSAGRRYIFENKKPEFIAITNEIDKTGEYFDELRRMYLSAKTGGRRTRRRRKTKTRRRHQRKTTKKPRKNRKRTRKTKRK